MGPGALFKLSSCLVKAVAVLLWSFVVALFGCGSHTVALQAVFSAWSRAYCHGLVSIWPWLLSPELILIWLLSSILLPGTSGASMMWMLGWSWCCLGPALLTLLRQGKGSGWWGHSPIFLVEQPTQLFQTHGSWASTHLILLLHNSFFFIVGR